MHSTVNDRGCNLFEVYYTEYNVQIYFLKTFSGPDLHEQSLINKEKPMKRRRRRCIIPGPALTAHAQEKPVPGSLVSVLLHHGVYRSPTPPRVLSPSHLQDASSVRPGLVPLCSLRVSGRAWHTRHVSSVSAERRRQPPRRSSATRPALR